MTYRLFRGELGSQDYADFAFIDLEKGVGLCRLRRHDPGGGTNNSKTPLLLRKAGCFVFSLRQNEFWLCPKTKQPGPSAWGVLLLLP